MDLIIEAIHCQSPLLFDHLLKTLPGVDPQAVLCAFFEYYSLRTIHIQWDKFSEIAERVLSQALYPKDFEKIPKFDLLLHAYVPETLVRKFFQKGRNCIKLNPFQILLSQSPLVADLSKFSSFVREFFPDWKWTSDHLDYVTRFGNYRLVRFLGKEMTEYADFTEFLRAVCQEKYENDVHQVLLIRSLVEHGPFGRFDPEIHQKIGELAPTYAHPYLMRFA